MVKRVQAGSSKGGEFAPDNKGKVAPTTKIEQNLIDSLSGYIKAEEKSNGASIGYQYGSMFKKFGEAQAKVERDISRLTREHTLSRSVTMFKKIEEDTMSEAAEATTAVNAFSTQISENNGDSNPVVTSIFKVARDEANDKAEKLTLKYLAAVEARRAFEAEELEAKTDIQERKVSGEHVCTMRNGRCTRLEYHI